LTTAVAIGYKGCMTPQQLVEFRERLGFTQQELADRLRVDRVTIARWETGARSIPPYLDLALETVARKRPGTRKGSAL
jgi:transcriptional regulator with XRE-family HTH domain